MVNSVLQTLTLKHIQFILISKGGKMRFGRIVHLILLVYDLTPLTIHVVLYLETCYKLSLNVFYYWALYICM